ncbi:hypothetical protein A3K70_00220 [Candidatus Bathyarchaeota archaeon RBG_16_48_13]|nr:MAG: hypothetical protein A3K70_00220 [Candidatus Bathyarchaeota archaeon RBG_16_48_13]
MIGRLFDRDGESERLNEPERVCVHRTKNDAERQNAERETRAMAPNWLLKCPRQLNVQMG